MSPTVRLDDIIDGMETASNDMKVYLHRASGEVFFVFTDMFDSPALDNDAERPWATAEAVDAHPEDYIALPDQFEINEYRMMQNFALSINNFHVQDQLLASIRGSGAFRRFKTTAHRTGVTDKWYAYRGNAFADIARRWCHDHGISLAE